MPPAEPPTLPIPPVDPTPPGVAMGAGKPLQFVNGDYVRGKRIDAEHLRYPAVFPSHTCTRYDSEKGGMTCLAFYTRASIHVKARGGQQCSHKEDLRGADESRASRSSPDRACCGAQASRRRANPRTA